MKKLMTILLIVCSFSLNAQQYFTKTFDIGYYENTDKMMIDDNGNVLLCGWHRSEGGTETGYILKLDADGEILWENQNYFFNDIIQTSDGNYCFSDKEMAVRKINQHTGELIWSFVGEELHPPLWLKYNNIIENNDGNIFIGVVGDLTPRILILSSEGELLEYNDFNYPLFGKTLKTIQVDDDEYITLNHCYRQDYPHPDHSKFITHQKDGTISIGSIFSGANLPMFTKDGDYLYTFRKLGLEHGRRFVVYKLAYPFTINITYNLFFFNNYTSKLVDITNYNHNFMIAGNVGNHIFIIGIDENLDEWTKA